MSYYYMFHQLLGQMGKFRDDPHHTCFHVIFPREKNWLRLHRVPKRMLQDEICKLLDVIQSSQIKKTRHHCLSIYQIDQPEGLERNVHAERIVQNIGEVYGPVIVKDESDNNDSKLLWYNLTRETQSIKRTIDAPKQPRRSTRLRKRPRIDYNE